jgi:hypothetical protein
MNNYLIITKQNKKMSTIDIISNNGKVLKVNINDPILNSGFFGLINKCISTELDFELLELIFSDNYNVPVDKIVTYIPILSSFCLTDKVKQLYLKLFSLTDENNHELIDELMDDMINYFGVEEINKMPDSIACKFVSRIIDNIDINEIFINVAELGYLETVKILINRGADIHIDNDEAIRWASLNGHLEIVKFLFGKGADIHADNNCAIRMASKNGHFEIVKFLFDKNADIHADNDYAIRLASSNGHLKIVKFLFGKGANIHSNNDYAIRWSSVNGHLDVVKFLFGKGADIHADNEYAIRMASKNGHLKIVKFLSDK